MTSIEFSELLKCKQSPAYFLNHYGKILDAVAGCVPFSLFKYQEIVLSKFLQNPYNIILKSRQMGLSWLVAGYALWLALFFEDKRILMISIKDVTAKALLKKVKYIYDRLPPFLRGVEEDRNMSKIVFDTGSEIASVPTSEDAGRSDSLSLLIIDEAAFVRWFDQIWQAAYPTLSTGGSAIVLSTPNGMGNSYADFWHRSIEGQSLFNPIRLLCSYYPGRDARWFEIQKMNMSKLQFAQEVLGDFISTGNLVFDIEALRVLFEECSMVEPLETFYSEESEREPCGLYLFEPVEPGTEYILSVDCALGGAGDFHGAHILKRSTGQQVAEYKSKVPLEIFNKRIFDLGLLFNNALAAIESNSMGVASNLYFKEHGYPNMYYYQNPFKPDQKKLGFPTDPLTRPILISELEDCIRTGVSGVSGIRTVNELMNFAWHNSKAQALPGKHDDLVMSLGIGRFVRRTNLTPLELPMLLF